MTNLKRLAILCVMSVMTFATTRAQWIDVTDMFITNPDFETGNTDGWTISSANGHNCGFQNATYENGGVRISRFAETWIPANTGTLGSTWIFQSTTLPKGKYRLSVDGIASWQNNPWVEPTGVYLYIDTYGSQWICTTPMASQNNRPEHFAMEFERDAEAEVYLGVKTDDDTNCNWIAVDNFKLEIDNSSLVPVKSLSFKQSTLKVSPGDVAQLEVAYTPSNATLKVCKFSSANENIARVDAKGSVKAYGIGTTEIYATAHNGLTAKCTIKVESAPYVDGGLVINEIQAANVDYVIDPSFNYGSWIELYNPTNTACGLAGLYITDDPDDLKKFRLSSYMGTVPAHGYKNVWFDHYGIWNMGEMQQVDFKLDYNGGTIIISDGNKILAQQDYPQAIGRTSYARTTDGGSTWGISANPTPEASNAGMKFAEKQLAAPVVNLDGQMFYGRLDVKVTIPIGETLRYTTDGSTPTLNNSKVSTNGKFTVEGTTVYRFRLFRDGYLPSEVVTRSYIYGDSNLDVISVVTDANTNLYSADYGIFTKGPNGRAGNGQDEKCNWNMEWDRPVNFEFITKDNECVVSQEVDMSVCGGWSRAWEPRSFKLKAAKYYQGQNTMDYQFFDGKPFLKHKTLQIRNGGNSGLLKDASLQEIMRRSGLYIETQSWRPVYVYINGRYHGQLNMREPNNKHYGYANYGIDTDEMDQFEMSPDSGYVQMTGTKEAFDRLIELSYNAADANTYEEIGKLLDIDEYINYMAAELYLENWDWPQNNVKGFRDRNDGKFRFVVFDLDGSFNGATFDTFHSKKNYTFDALRGNDPLGNWPKDKRFTKEIEFVTLFENLLKNESFRRRFVDAICVIGGSTFHPDFVQPIVDEMASTMNVWRDNPTGNLSQNRQYNIANRLKVSAYDFGLGNSNILNATLSSNVDGAGIYVNDMPVPTGKFSGMLYQPATVKAIAPAGYVFKGWRLTNGSLDGNYETKTIFNKGTTWSYYDGTDNLHGTDWKSASYVSSWPTGKAPIGYDKDNNPKGLNTWFSHKVLPTYYVSKNFNLDSKSDGDIFWIEFRVDDGMVIYINGKEAARHNLPGGEIKYNTYSLTWADGQCDYGTIELPNGLFRIGENTIAVEIHNNDNVSSDIHWDAALIHQVLQTSGEPQYASTDTEITVPMGDNVQLVAIYEPMPETTLAENGVFPVRINEVSASNTMYVNDYFKKDDWIELYNTTSQPIDVAGMYLSDNANKPQKFQIPEDDKLETVIEPYGHLIIWASKRDAIGEQIHANFKLSNDDDQLVMLTSADREWHDKFVYNIHNGDESVGRYPDGSNEIYKMQLPTIGKTNVLTSYAEYLFTDKPEPTGIGNVMVADDNLAVKAIEYYSLNGIYMGASKANLAKGIYIVKYTRSNGTTVSKKVIIK